MIWNEFLSHFSSCDEEDSGLLTKNRNENGKKIAQSTHENGNIKQGKTFCRNSKQFFNVAMTEKPNVTEEGVGAVQQC